MLQQDEPEDFVLAAGTGTTVRDFCRLALTMRVSTRRSMPRYDDRYERVTEADVSIPDCAADTDVLS
jgi:GDPmannose 4,6-dehydratase